MRGRRMDEFGALAWLKRLGPADKLGAAAIAVGALLVAGGLYSQGDSGSALGDAFRTMGGLAIIGGIAAIALWEPRRRDAIVRVAIVISNGYMARTAHWRWPNRYGLAAVIVGLALSVPGAMLGLIFGTGLGRLVLISAVVLFWAGVALLVYGVFQQVRERRGQGPPYRGGRGGRGRRGG